MRLDFPDTAAHQPDVTAPIFLLVSQERVGRSIVADALREARVQTLFADGAVQAVRRLAASHRTFDGVIVVGDLTDGSATSLQRWLRSQDHPTLPIIGIGATVDQRDPYAVEVPAASLLQGAGITPEAARLLGVRTAVLA